jgi:hypothetical protein
MTGPMIVPGGGQVRVPPQNTLQSATIFYQENHQLAIPAIIPLRQLSTSGLLRRIVHWDGQSRDITQVLTAAFRAEDYPRRIRDLKGQDIDPQSYIDSLDRVSSCWILA